MGERLDELCETAADEQENGRSKKSRHARRWALLVVVLSVAALAWSCVFHGNLTRKPVGFLTTNDAVIALRLGGGRTTAGDDKPYYDGWIVLLDAQGRGQVASVDEINGGDVLWSDRGVFYGSPSQDYVTTDSGTQQTTWQFTRRGDVQRYALPDGALVAVRRESNDYHIGTLFPDGTHASVETEGVGRGIGQCGGRIVAITTTEKSESIKSAAFEAYAAQFGGGDMPEALEVVVQLNDFDGDVPPVLAVAPMGEGLSSNQHMFDCEGEVITVPSAQKNGEREWLVLQRWDLSTGQRTIIPVVDEDGNAIELGEDLGVSDSEAIRVGNEYRFVSWGGDAFAVDPASGQGRYLFSLDTPRYGPDGYLVTFQVSESGVYALKDRRADRVVTLSYRPWEGGEWRDIFTTRDLAYYLNEGYISGALDIQSFAVRPGWNGGAQ
ncbi:hypothetical protein HMPREF1478_00815 [Actinomyces sp. HPA0247]|uniref:hypothetical protein n=1 Tax=Actinomyces sp. HPA0247 TaxID=1203556 RepID=UPI00034E1162|nr:hypothetical protein [Actinomyces sp. HPA0247]EPD73167.1 hypothetical protein HMPREF1478_00815 [Actinomyces sp. HPA0247]